jgi:hypothetical protein
MVFARQLAQPKNIFQQFLLELQSLVHWNHRIDKAVGEVDDWSRDVRRNATATSNNEIVVKPHGVSQTLGCCTLEEPETPSDIPKRVHARREFVADTAKPCKPMLARAASALNLR